MHKAVVFDCDGTLLDTSGSKFRAYAGIPELLHRLKQQDYGLFVWTGRDRPSTEKYLQEFGLRRFFEDIRCAGDCAPKPHVEGLKQLLGHFDPSRCVVIGDSWADMKGAKLFGAFALGAVWNKQASPEALTEFGAEVLVSQPSDCYDVILRF